MPGKRRSPKPQKPKCKIQGNSKIAPAHLTQMREERNFNLERRWGDYPITVSTFALGFCRAVPSCQRGEEPSTPLCTLTVPSAVSWDHLNPLHS